MMPPRLSPRNGSCPVAANSTTAPHANTSAADPAAWPVSISGAWYVYAPTGPDTGSPSSITLGPSSASSTLSGFSPRWVSPASCSARSTSASAPASATSSSPVYGPVQRDGLPQVGPVDELAHHVRDASVGPDGDHLRQMAGRSPARTGARPRPRGTVTANLRPSSS
ncbi:hypothetical protein GCM10020220_064700 [Nonomuraea rubra]